MSNRLLNAAMAITTINGRKIHPSEKLVLLALADDARDHLGGRTKDLIINRQVQEATGLSERAVRMAISALITAGHISRQPGKPGAAMETVVHPGGAIAPPADIAAQPADIAAQPATVAGGPYSNKDITQIPHTPTQRACEPAAADQGVEDPVEQVFAAWDAYHQRVGLRPLARGPLRRGAVAAKIEAQGLGNVLMVIDSTERAFRAKRAPPGQDDLFFSFDSVFGVGNLTTRNLFDRMLDGQFDPPAVAKTAEPVARVDRSDEGEAGRLRQAVRADVGDHSYQAWIEPCRFEFDGDALVLTAPSAFKADWVQQHFADTLRRHAAKMTGGQIRRVIARAHAPA